MVKDGQVRKLRRFLDQGTSLAQAAGRTGMSKKTARHYRDDPALISPSRGSRGPSTGVDSQRLVRDSFKGRIRCFGRNCGCGLRRERGAVAESPQAAGEDAGEFAAALVRGQFGRGRFGTRMRSHGTTPEGVPTATSTGWRAGCRTGANEKGSTMLIGRSREK